MRVATFDLALSLNQSKHIYVAVVSRLKCRLVWRVNHYQTNTKYHFDLTA